MRLLALGWLALAAALLVVYAPHFRNPFAFDDSHTIENNAAIRSLRNVPRFFVDATTTSSLPASQAWRPGLTTLNAIDTWLSGGMPRPEVFHRSIFAGFLALSALLVVLFAALFEQTLPGDPLNPWLALFGGALFCLHTATVETIDYVIARSDSFSTLLVVAGLALAVGSPRARRAGLWVLPMALGFTVKEPAVVLVALVAAYVLLWQHDALRRPTAARELAPLAAGAATALALVALSRRLTPPHWSGGGGAWLPYVRTQVWVLVHDLATFVLPARLSADTDWTVLADPLDDRVLIGIAVLVALLVAIVRCARRPTLRPIAFGLSWFLLALAPTSLVPLAEVTNDHRLFFPFVGLALATAWGAGRLLVRFGGAPGSRRGRTARAVAAGLALALLAAHAVGARARIAVWSSAESLWADVVAKSPGNGRGRMNYGLALLARGDLPGAERAFREAQALWPRYPYLAVNLGIATAAQGRDGEAEAHFRRALALDPRNPECYAWFAQFLRSRGRGAEARQLVDAGLRLSPAHTVLRRLDADLRADREIPAAAPAGDATPEAWLAASLQRYRAGDFAGSAEAARTALRLRPGWADALNNVCAAENELGRFDAALAACAQALAADPAHVLARNNFAEAGRRRAAALAGGATRR